MFKQEVKKLRFSLILAVFFLLAAVFPALALNKDEQIYTSFQEILDRDPTMVEYHSFIRGYQGQNYVKKSLNQTVERSKVIKDIYQQALKRYPRPDELEALIKFVAPNNLIRKQLYESEERKLAINDAYQKFLGREPSIGDLEFYVNTRSPFEKIKEVLNSSEERKEVLIGKYKFENKTEPNPNELAYMIENQIVLDQASDVKVLGIEYSEPIKKEGPILIVWFNDFECLYCAEFSQTLNQVKKYFGGQIDVEFKHFPLPFHRQAIKAAMAYECAVEQGTGNQMSELIYQSRVDEQMSVASWKIAIIDLNINNEQFVDCLDGDQYLDKINNDIKEGEKLGVSGTPTVFIEEEKILGNVGFDEIIEIINKYK